MVIAQFPITPELEREGLIFIGSHDQDRVARFISRHVRGNLAEVKLLSRSRNFELVIGIELPGNVKVDRAIVALGDDNFIRLIWLPLADLSIVQRNGSQRLQREDVVVFRYL